MYHKFSGKVLYEHNIQQKRIFVHQRETVLNSYVLTEFWFDIASIYLAGERTHRFSHIERIAATTLNALKVTSNVVVISFSLWAVDKNML